MSLTSTLSNQLFNRWTAKIVKASPEAFHVPKTPVMGGDTYWENKRQEWCKKT